MRLIYTDEAGTSSTTQEPFLVVAGVMINADEQFRSVEAHLDELVAKYIAKESHDGFAFHAMELFHGTKRFSDRSVWTLERRLEILDDIASIPRKFDLPICYGIINRTILPQNLPSATPRQLEGIAHAHALFKCALQAEIILQASAPNEVGMLIAEDRDQVRRILKHSHALFRGRLSEDHKAAIGFDDIREGNIGKLIPFTKIVETVHFAQKHESSLLQVADLCAFAIKRDFTKSPHSDRLYNAICDQIVFRQA